MVAFIEPCVKAGVTVFALATEGDNSAKRRIHFFIYVSVGLGLESGTNTAPSILRGVSTRIV